jgi:GTP-binding protein HflX
LSRALLITYPNEYAIEEAGELTKAAGYEPVAIVTQGYLSRAKYGVGEGKAEEAAKIIKDLSLDMIIFDSSLSTASAYNLAKLCRVEVKDREKIILEIFAKRASTAEAKLQVQLAELVYELPRARDKVRMAKRGEQPGFFGLGKYEVDVYTRMIKSRIGVLKKKVDEVRKRRRVFREARARQMFPTVVLTGYTASGKTTLFNRLTGENKEADAGVFTTLTPTTRALMIDGRKKGLLTDTVGFISNLPTYLVEAFKSTLEEISLADVVLLLVDVSQPDEKFTKSFLSSLEILSDLGVRPSKTIVVLNKCDLTNRETIERRIQENGLNEVILISARTGAGIRELMAAVESRLSGKGPEDTALIEA